MPDQISYDSNGYAQMMALPDMNAPNPWAAMAQQSQTQVNVAGNAASNIPQYQQGIAQNQANMNNYAQATASPQINYPALPNDYGLGNTSNNSNADTASHGFNPWSLKGEALSR
jgi:hypothetical protein